MFVDPVQGVGLAHTRLAIQDLSPAGHQPMSSVDERYQLVFNGEIYNVSDLRRKLEADGETFRSRSDTEVVLRLYQRLGPQFVERLQGMFAIAIWDKHDGSWFLARDPLGIKPLYIWERGNTFAFASEVRALLAANVGPRQLCAQAVRGYVLFGSVQEPLTLVEGIRSLPAGYRMSWSSGIGQLDPFWQLSLDGTAQSNDGGSAPLRVRKALDASVRRHFVSDVPVGIFLSGGIDSTVVAALSRKHNTCDLRSFCISFDDHRFDEGDLAAKTASHFGLEHHDWRMTQSEGRRLFSEFIGSVDQPSIDGFNTFCVSKFARDSGMKVVLSGLGGDEAFGGYPSFQMIPKLLKWHRWLSRLGRWKEPLADTAMRCGGSRLQRLGSYLKTDGSLTSAYWAMRGIFTPTEADLLLSGYCGEDAATAAGGCFNSPVPSHATLTDAVSYLEMTRYMRNQLLRDSDAMSMAHGLELRVPLVDQHLIESIASIPSHQRLATGKQLLKLAVPEIPDWITRQSKRGFQFPLQDWIDHEWREIFSQIAQLTPVPLESWYRRWCLFMLNTFIQQNNIESERFNNIARREKAA